MYKSPAAVGKRAFKQRLAESDGIQGKNRRRMSVVCPSSSSSCIIAFPESVVSPPFPPSTALSFTSPFSPLSVSRPYFLKGVFVCLFVCFFCPVLFHVITCFAYSYNSLSLFFTGRLLCFTVTESIMEFICVTVKLSVGAIFLLSQEEYVCLCVFQGLCQSCQKSKTHGRIKHSAVTSYNWTTIET